MGIADENWDYEIDFEECVKSSNDLFQSELNNICQNVLKTIDNGFVNVDVDKDSLARNNDDEIKLLSEKNKDLKLEIETKLKELTQQQGQYENFKQDHKLLEQQVKKTHEAFLMARKHHKKCLNMYYSIESKSNESQLVFIQFFTELKKNNENYSVNLLRNPQTRQYTLQSTNPTLKNFKELQRQMKETNDVPAVLCCIREAFKTHKLSNAH
ncbi:uncharacterized protein LOC112048143 [Bicyclus anynana]|uniref:Kinetochore protein SPC25 n=1 Tax=Bicyclus anynana TaxID=110368 RepID=A0A6J1NDZ9_BICAN|nr:uncharacterized protein LOC112048143 [Bicyclus anynana]